MKGYDNYIDSLDEGLDFVLKAISEGDVNLTKEELINLINKNYPDDTITKHEDISLNDLTNREVSLKVFK